MLLALVLPAGVFAQTDTVSATVTGSLLSVEVTDGVVAYGVLPLSGSQDTLVGNLDDLQTATNNGTVPAKFNIMSSNAIGGTTDWTLAGTAGANVYTHAFSVNAGGAWTPLTSGYQELAASVAVDGTQTFDLQIGMPVSTDDYAEHDITVTVQAVTP
ncbi:hypothetical protein ACFLTL_00295 [Chloroflexota bacterium]